MYICSVLELFSLCRLGITEELNADYKPDTLTFSFTFTFTFTFTLHRVSHGERLAEWKSEGKNWMIVESKAFVEVTGRANFGRVIYALGLFNYEYMIFSFFFLVRYLMDKHGLFYELHIWHLAGQSASPHGNGRSVSISTW